MLWRPAVLTSLVGLSSGCVGTSGGTTTTEDEVPVASSTTAATPEGSETSGGLQGCGENLLEDPGFEAGTPSAAWDEVSPLFGTPICSAECTQDVGAAPFVGDWWVWFGGVARADSPSVSQTITIPEGLAMLRFGFSLNAGAGSGNDVFSVSIDDQTLRVVSDAEESAYGGWRIVELDVSRFADGGQHTLMFSATIAGAGVTNFFVDAVELLPCEGAGAGSSTSGPASTSSSSSSSTSA